MGGGCVCGRREVRSRRAEQEGGREGDVGSNARPHLQIVLPTFHRFGRLGGKVDGFEFQGRVTLQVLLHFPSCNREVCRQSWEPVLQKSQAVGQLGLDGRDVLSRALFVSNTRVGVHVRTVAPMLDSSVNQPCASGPIRCLTSLDIIDTHVAGFTSWGSWATVSGASGVSGCSGWVGWGGVGWGGVCVGVGGGWCGGWCVVCGV